MANKSFKAFIRTGEGDTLVITQLPETTPRFLIGIEPTGVILDGDNANRLAYALRLREGARVDAECGMVVRLVRTNRGDPYRDGFEIDLGTETRCLGAFFVEDHDASELADFIAPRPI